MHFMRYYACAMAFGRGFVLVFKVDRVQYAYRLLIVSWCHSVHAIIFAELSA